MVSRYSSKQMVQPQLLAVSRLFLIICQTSFDLNNFDDCSCQFSSWKKGLPLFPKMINMLSTVRTDIFCSKSVLDTSATKDQSIFHCQIILYNSHFLSSSSGLPLVLRKLVMQALVHHQFICSFSTDISFHIWFGPQAKNHRCMINTWFLPGLVGICASRSTENSK